MHLWGASFFCFILILEFQETDDVAYGWRQNPLSPHVNVMVSHFT